MKRRNMIILSAVVAAILAAAVCVVLYRYNSRKSYEADKKAAKCLMDKGYSELIKPDLTNAATDLSQSLLLYEQLNDSHGIRSAKLCLAILYSEIDQLDDAYKLMKDVGEPHATSPKSDNALIYYRLMGFLKMSVDKDYEAAVQSERKALDLLYKYTPRDTTDIFIEMANIAEIYVNMGKSDSAKNIIAKIESDKMTTSDSYLSQMYYCKGYIFYLEKQYDKAVEVLNKNVVITRKDRITRNHLSSLALLMKVDSARNDFRSYMAHLGEYATVKKSLTGKNTEFQTEIIKAQLKLSTMQFQQKATRARHHQTVIIMMFALALLVSISAILLLLFRRTQISRKLAESEKERLAAKVTYDALERELYEIKMKNAGEKLTAANKENITMSLKLAASDDTNGANALRPFETSFMQSDSEFLKALEKKYPTLSKTEIRLLCFIRSGMSSKEITSVLNITMNSLHTSRYRLRKKLDIPQNADLDLFINTML